MDGLDSFMERGYQTQYCRVAEGEHHALSILPSGMVVSSGSSALYEEGECFIAHLGIGKDWGSAVAAPVAMHLTEGMSQVVEVSAGRLHSLLLCSDGTVWSCGGGWEGVLGHGTELSVCIPRQIAALSRVSILHISAGGSHSLAVSSTGELYSWGWGQFGQLGHGDRTNRLIPRRNEILSVHIVQVAAGRAHSIVLDHANHAYVFGSSSGGQCGASFDVLEPVQIEALHHSTIVDIHADVDLSTFRTASGSTVELGTRTPDL